MEEMMHLGEEQEQEQAVAVAAAVDQEVATEMTMVQEEVGGEVGGVAVVEGEVAVAETEAAAVAEREEAEAEVVPEPPEMWRMIPSTLTQMMVSDYELTVEYSPHSCHRPCTGTTSQITQYTSESNYSCCPQASANSRSKSFLWWDRCRRKPWESECLQLRNSSNFRRQFRQRTTTLEVWKYTCHLSILRCRYNTTDRY